jgi:adenosine kinase
MRKNKPATIVVSGSLAYDQIMDFPGRFRDHILPGQIHNLNISFILGGAQTSFGGTAGNIAYNLGLLQAKPTILGIVGSDFSEYRRHLAKSGADLSRIATAASASDGVSAQTAAAYIITDRDDNQIAAFYPGPSLKNYARRAAGRLKNVDLAIIAADDKLRMLDYAAAYRRRQVPYVFDPGQALTAFSGAELRRALVGAKVLIGNDYEIKMILNKIAARFNDLRKLTEILVITKGARGSEIYRGGEKIIINPARPKNTSDPTGAGDAYRAGLIKGLLNGYNLKTCGQLAGLVACYTVEKAGTQTHRFTIKELQSRYYANFKEKLII